ncbi:MAG: heavy metal translocating P-type ATPase [Phycisphaerae bacterium]|nr:heavy metal translocating P-type ATPase [Phycisphaerae bacterium]
MTITSDVTNTRSVPAKRCDCSHCGLPVPPGLVEQGHEQQFCCEGCKAVWHSLHACGLERYYDLAARDHEARERRSATVTNRKFGHFDQPIFLEKYARAITPERSHTELRIDGLHCGACVWLLESLPKITPGLVAVRVDLSRNAVFVDWDPAALALSEVARRFDRLGYQLLAPLDPAAQRKERGVDRAWLVRIGVAAVLASNSMAVAFALYSGYFATMAPAYRLFFQWISVGIAILALVGPGRVFFANAIAAIRTRTPHIDIPVATGIFGAVASGLVNTILGEGSIYCESATMLVFLLLVGRFVQYRQQRRARQQVELITSLVPSVARRRGAEGSVDEVPVESLAPGDVVDVPAGEVIPCDGTLLDAPARFDLSLLTGESRPQSIADGADVWAGTRTVDRPVSVLVRVAGAQTRAGRLLAMVTEAASRRPPIVELTDRIAGWFLLGVLVAAAFTLWWTWPLGHSVAIGRTVALLVVTCPCALGLATPLAVVAAIGKAARVGVLVKGGDVLERLATPGTVVLDKTGTITEGRIAVTEIDGDRFGAVLAACVERTSAHPIATAIVQHALDVAAEALRALPAPADVREVAGRGIEGRVEGDAHGPIVVRVGNEGFIAEACGPAPAWASAAAARILGRGESPVFVGCNAEWSCVMAVGDPIRPEARATIDELRAMGWRVTMCSGDHVAVARAVARAVGLRDDDVAGGVSPEGKVAFVRDRGLASPVVMVGDGVNDLAAMAAADVGVAVRNGAQSAMHVADACLARPGLAPLERLLDGSRRTLRAIRVNLVVSVAYNVAGGALAFFGLVNPLVAAILMPVSSLTVLAIALGMPRFDVTPRVGADAGHSRKDGR